MRQYVKLKLDTTTFDESPFAPAFASCRREGVLFKTFANLGDSIENRRKLYDLNKECSADIPGRGAFYLYDDYVAERLDRPQNDPSGIIIALKDDAWVGMSATSDWSGKGFAFAEMTGVVRAFRRRGISLALKLLAIRFARSRGATSMLTCHDAENIAPIALNRRLGFVDADWDLSLIE